MGAVAGTSQTLHGGISNEMMMENLSPFRGLSRVFGHLTVIWYILGKMLSISFWRKRNLGLEVNYLPSFLWPNECLGCSFKLRETNLCRYILIVTDITWYQWPLVWNLSFSCTICGEYKCRGEWCLRYSLVSYKLKIALCHPSKLCRKYTLGFSNFSRDLKLFQANLANFKEDVSYVFQLIIWAEDSFRLY